MESSESKKSLGFEVRCATPSGSAEEKARAVKTLSEAIDGVTPQRFPDRSLKGAKELTRWDISMGEVEVSATVSPRMAVYEKVAEAMIEMDGGIHGYVMKKGSWGARWQSVWLSALGRCDWDETLRKTKEQLARLLAQESLGKMEEEAKKRIAEKEQEGAAD